MNPPTFRPLTSPVEFLKIATTPIPSPALRIIFPLSTLPNMHCSRLLFYHSSLIYMSRCASPSLVLQLFYIRISCRFPMTFHVLVFLCYNFYKVARTSIVPGKRGEFKYPTRTWSLPKEPLHTATGTLRSRFRSLAKRPKIIPDFVTAPN